MWLCQLPSRPSPSPVAECRRRARGFPSHPGVGRERPWRRRVAGAAAPAIPGGSGHPAAGCGCRHDGAAGADPEHRLLPSFGQLTVQSAPRLLPASCYQLRAESTYDGSCWSQTYFLLGSQLTENCRGINAELSESADPDAVT